MLVLPATVTLDVARDVLAMLKPALAREPNDQAVVDASGLVHFDSSALSLLLECRRSALASGRSFTVRGAVPRLAQLATLYGVGELLDGAAPATAAQGAPA